jgi:hypothetical protein
MSTEQIKSPVKEIKSRDVREKTETGLRERDINVNDQKIVEKIVAVAAADENPEKKSEFFAKILEFINENLTLVIIASILILALIVYIICNYTTSGKNFMKRYRKSHDNETETGPPAQKENNKSQVNEKSNDDETIAEFPEQESVSQQEQFANDFHKYIKEAIQILHKKNKIESKTQLREYIISYTQEKMNYPATDQAHAEATAYITNMINDAFRDLKENDDEPSGENEVENKCDDSDCETDNGQLVDTVTDSDAGSDAGDDEPENSNVCEDLPEQSDANEKPEQSVVQNVSRRKKNNVKNEAANDKNAQVDNGEIRRKKKR